VWLGELNTARNCHKAPKEAARQSGKLASIGNTGKLSIPNNKINITIQGHGHLRRGELGRLQHFWLPPSLGVVLWFLNRTEGLMIGHLLFNKCQQYILD
jgi:hypothetical protein